jgi:hypothetical protein
LIFICSCNMDLNPARSSPKGGFNVIEGRGDLIFLTGDWQKPLWVWNKCHEEVMQKSTLNIVICEEMYICGRVKQYLDYLGYYFSVIVVTWSSLAKWRQTNIDQTNGKILSCYAVKMLVNSFIERVSLCKI